MELIGYALAIVMGLVLGTMGAGGAILTVPILHYFFRQEAYAATTGSLFIVGVTAFFGALLNWRKGQIDFRTGIFFSLPSFIGVFVARKFLAPLVSDKVVLISFASLMIIAAHRMIKSAKTASTTDRINTPPLKIGLKGLLVGATTGFVGAGGGFLIIPALVTLLHLPIRVAIGTSMAIVALNSLFGFAVSSKISDLNWQVLLSIILLGAVGTMIGHHYSHRFNEQRLKVWFGYFVLLVAVFLIGDQVIKILL